MRKYFILIQQNLRSPADEEAFNYYNHFSFPQLPIYTLGIGATSMCRFLIFIDFQINFKNIKKTIFKYFTYQHYMTGLTPPRSQNLGIMKLQF